MSQGRRSVALQLGGSHLQGASRTSESSISSFRNSFQLCHRPGWARSRPSQAACWRSASAAVADVPSVLQNGSCSVIDEEFAIADVPREHGV
jgi:hypothetical protein